MLTSELKNKDNVIDTISSTEVITATKLSMSYGKLVALENFSFSLKKGHILGFLGPNGAGKTTAIRILTTILTPLAGTYSIDGYGPPDLEKIRERIGVLPESHGFPKQMTGFEYLRYFGRLYGWSKEIATQKANELLLEVGLSKRQNSLIGSYSRGMRQRLGIARALINNPVVMFLDEPTLGLDPKGQEELLSLISSIAKQHDAAIILCSHLLSEVESICDDVIILKSGKIIASGTVGEIIGKGIVRVIRIQTSEDTLNDSIGILNELETVKGVKISDRLPNTIEVELLHDSKISEEKSTNQILGTLINRDIPIVKFDTLGTRLHDVYLQLTEES